MTGTPDIAPVLVELTRRNVVECRHRGAIAIADARAEVFAYGDVDRMVFPRSAIKSLQALPLILSGGADAFSLTDRELALCCASHSGAPDHVEAAREIVTRIGLEEGALVCGPHLPLGDEFAHDLLRANDEATRYHNNCSGKHAGMLAAAVHMGEPTDGYHALDHPVQRRVRDAVSEIADVELGDEAWGIDGCSVPNWSLPLKDLARAFARFVSGDEIADSARGAAERLVAACWKHPEMVAGRGRVDTVLMRRFAGDVFLKTGAEGVYCGGIRSLGLGFALKVEDGAKRASEATVSAILGTLIADAKDLAEARPLTNWGGIDVGEMRIAQDLRAQLVKFAGTVGRG